MSGGDELPSLDDWGPADEDFWRAHSFVVPPPPPPSVCSAAPFYCDLEGGPMGAHFDKAAFPSLPIIAVCSSVVLVAVLVASFLLWRHKSKVQNLLPCKSDPPGHLGAANGITYEDVLLNHHPTRLPTQAHHLPGTTLQILDVKLGDMGTSPTFYPNGDPSSVVASPFHPVYEEVCQADKPKSEFAEDEYPSGDGSGQCSATSSVRGSTGGDLCRDPVSSEEDCDYMMGEHSSFGYHPAGKRDALATYPLPERTLPPFAAVLPPPKWPDGPSQENIYSTIDEDELPAVHLTSLPKSGVPARPLVSQRHTEDSSYGDIRPAFAADASSFA